MLAAQTFSDLSQVFDCHNALNAFYVAHVRLGRDRRSRLAGHRDANLDRLSAGLEKLGALEGASSAGYDDWLPQGSYAMHTLNQHRDNDYDIDTGVVFLRENLPEDAIEARRRVARALREGGGTFSKPPEARTNAVTAWYAAGHHVDLAIYRRNGVVLEHAGGGTWNVCDPEQIPLWFKAQNIALSPEHALAACYRCRDQAGDGLRFPCARGTLEHHIGAVETLQQALGVVIQRAGLRHIGWHALRHYAEDLIMPSDKLGSVARSVDLERNGWAHSA